LLQSYAELRGQGWYVAGTQVPLESLVRLHEAGLHPNAILRRLPDLTLEQIYGAIAFHLAQGREVDGKPGGAAPRAEAANELGRAIRTLLNDAERRREVQAWKHGPCRFDAPDFIWNALLYTCATMGNSRGGALLTNPDLHGRVRYEGLRALSSPSRGQALGDALREAGVRMPARKTEWLLENFERIEARGGPEAVKAQLEGFVGRSAKIAFLRSFRGIAEQQALNLMMAAYHPDFRDAIAMDERIGKISERLGVDFGGFADAEAFYLEAAHAAGLEGWELDRLLHHFSGEVLAAL
jgi:uncharacterized protein DUF433